MDNAPDRAKDDDVSRRRQLRARIDIAEHGEMTGMMQRHAGAKGATDIAHRQLIARHDRNMVRWFVATHRRLRTRVSALFLVVAFAAVEDIVAAVAEEGVIAVAAKQKVGTPLAVQVIVAVAAIEGVIAAAADFLAAQTGRRLEMADPRTLEAALRRAVADGPLQSLAIILPSWDESGRASAARYRGVLGVLRSSKHAIGGLVFGIGMALHEETTLDPSLGRVVNRNLADYLVPVNADVPHIDVHLVEETDEHLDTGGVKGIGMIGTVGTAAAIANAVFHATGRRIRDLPIRIEHFLI